MNFENKVVIVTGAGTGIGKEIAILFSELGAKLSIAGRRKSKLSAVKKIIEIILAGALQSRQMSLK